MLAEICSRGICQRLPATVALIALVSAVPLAAQVSVSSEVQGAGYPRAARARSAEDLGVRWWASLDYDGVRRGRAEFRGDLVIYASDHRRALVDGEARLAWRARGVEFVGGLLRESWGRSNNSELDALGAANTPFSLVHPQARLSQPTFRTTLFFPAMSVDVYALAGHRPQSLPASVQRLSFGVSAQNIVSRGALGDQALAVRLSGTKRTFDWSAHVFKGLNRRPTFVPRFTLDGLTGVDAIYTDVLQVGGDMETIAGDWRLIAEGFSKRGAVDVTGRRQTYGYALAAAEYQRFGVFGGAYDIIPRLQVAADTRGDRADLPFASALRAGLRVSKTHVRAAQVEMAYSYDWSFRSHGFIGSGEKKLAEDPTVLVGGRITVVSAGAKPSVLDIWSRDLEVMTYLRIEFSR
jgi:hypothetical protein